jgi:hypothetical protein
MSRATSSEVVGVMSNEVPAGTDLSTFISVASCIIADNLDETLFNDDTLKNIEIYLAAHFSALKYKNAIETQMGGTNSARDKFGYPLGKGLELTTYGQMAIMLDFSKALGSLSSTKNKVSLGLLEDERDWTNT